MLEPLLAWAALLLALVVVVIGRSHNGGALTLAYFLGLSLIHVPGVLPVIFSRLDLADTDVTEIGFEMTLLGMAAFVIGTMVAGGGLGRHAAPRRDSPQKRARAFNRFGARALALGIAAYFVFIPISFSIPSLNSVASALATLLILGFWLILYGAVIGHDGSRIITTLALLPLLPLATLVSVGFLGYGVYWVLSVITFLFIIARQRVLFYVATPMVIYLGLSLFVTYMGERAGVRQLVWQEHATLIDRLDRASTIVTKFQLLDLNSPDHVTALDDRLNQNALVGAAVLHHEAGFSDFAYGATLPFWAVIPRAVWPDKPTVGGGLDVVSDFTGIQFAEGTSVGAGQVLEFYINFGVPGIGLGFFLLGFILMRLDHGIMHALAANNMRGFLLRAMPGLTLLQPGGNLLEIVVAAAAAFIVAHAVGRIRLFAASAPTPVQSAGLRRLRRDA